MSIVINKEIQVHINKYVKNQYLRKDLINVLTCVESFMNFWSQYSRINVYKRLIFFSQCFIDLINLLSGQYGESIITAGFFGLNYFDLDRFVIIHLVSPSTPKELANTLSVAIRSWAKIRADSLGFTSNPDVRKHLGENIKLFRNMFACDIEDIEGALSVYKLIQSKNKGKKD